jgi:hypothetical protein
MFVFAGVAMEGWVIWREYRDGMEEWALGYFLGTPPLPAKPSTRRLVFEVISVVFVTLGIAGELGIGIRITSINGELRDKNAELRGKSDQLIALIKQESSDSNKSAAEAKLETARLEAQIQPRSYTSREIEVIDKACRPFIGTAVVMRSLPYDVEGAVFGTYLAQILAGKDCGLVVNISGVGNNFMMNLPMFMDVHVVGPPQDRELVNSLVKALNTARVKAFSGFLGMAPPSQVQIFIGAKRLSPPA